jgi:hypothetical protein
MSVQFRSQWFTSLRRALFPPRPTPLTGRHRRPRLEALDPRIVPSADLWIAGGGIPVNWDTPAAWSLGAAPRAGDDVIFQTDALGSGSAPVSLGHATPLFHSVTFDGSWSATLTLQADAIHQTAGQLNAEVITLDARPRPGDEVLLDPGSEVHSDTALNLFGGSIVGAGVVQAEGTVTVDGTSAADSPTLGAYLEVGDGITPTTMTFAEQSVPLVVMADGNIDVQANASADFLTMPAGGLAAVAVVSADAGPHTLTLDGGTVSREDTSELLVGMGTEVNTGTLETFPSPQQGVQAGNPMHFTGFNADGQGLTVQGGQVLVSGLLSIDGGVRIDGGRVDVAAGATLEAGTVAAPVTNYLGGSGDLRLQGTFRSHGDFLMSGGVLESMGSPDSRIVLDPGDTFFLQGGTLIGSPSVSGGMFVSGPAPSQPPPVPPIRPPDADLAFAAVQPAAPQPSPGLTPSPGLPDGGITSGSSAAAWPPLIPNGFPPVS